MTARPSLTRRGRTMVVVALLATGLTTVSESPSVDVVAVATASLVITTGGWLVLVDVPRIERDVDAAGTVGETVRVHLTLPDRPGLSLRIRDRVGSVADASAMFDTVADGRTVAYDLTLHRRGIQWIGPISVAMRDPFGVWTRRAVVDGRDDLTVYPRRRPLRADVGESLQATEERVDRTTVETVREYVPSDALRRVNWRASAKRPDTWVVNEFGGTASPESIVVDVEADRARACDTVAEAAASVAVHFLDRGRFVGLRTPSVTIAPGSGTAHRRRLFEALARFDGGRVPSAESSSTVVRIGDEREGRVTVMMGETVESYRSLLVDEAAGKPTADGAAGEPTAHRGRWATISGDELAP